MKDVRVLIDVRNETNRFLDKLELAINEQSDKNNYSSKFFAASKRAALDLKSELTRLTQAGRLPSK